MQPVLGSQAVNLPLTGVCNIQAKQTFYLHQHLISANAGSERELVRRREVEVYAWVHHVKVVQTGTGSRWRSWGRGERHVGAG